MKTIRDPDAPGIFPARRAWTAVVLLTIVGTVNLADRFLPAVLGELIKHDLALSDTALGVINGFGFLLVYAICGIPLARLADRGIYGLVIATCMTGWSVMTMVGGMASSGVQLALSRMGVAVGEAGSTPSAHAFIARNFAPDRRAAPLAVLTMSVPLAGTAGLIGGGLLGQWLGWRATFLVLGAAGLVLVPPVLLVMKPRQRLPGVAQTTGGVAGAGWAGLLSKPSYRAILAAAAAIAVAGYSLTVFAPAYLIRVQGLTVGQVGVRYGFASGLVGLIGLLLIGRIADRMSRRDPRWLLWTVAAMIVLLLPVSSCAFMLGDATASIMAIALANVVGMAWMSPTIAAIQRIARPEQRATASAILLFCSATIGATGPLVTGAISDAYHAQIGSASLSKALLIVPIMHVVALACYLVAARTFRADIVPDLEGADRG